MSGRISLPVFAGLAVGIGMIFILAIVFNSLNNSTSPTSPRISSDDSIRIVGNDILRWNREVGINYTVTDIAISVPKFSNYVPTYVPFKEFKEKDMRLPLVYVGSNSNVTVTRIFENGKVHVAQIRPDQRAAAQIAQSPRRGQHEGRRVEVERAVYILARAIQSRLLAGGVGTLAAG